MSRTVSIIKIEFTKVDESTYTFFMPAVKDVTYVRLSCFFDFIKYHVTYETDFGDAQISDEDKEYSYANRQEKSVDSAKLITVLFILLLRD